jgi:NADPH-dependent curcumin reductase CurA
MPDHFGARVAAPSAHTVAAECPSLTDDVARRVVLARRPRGIPTVEDFSLVDLAIPEPGTGEFLIEAHWLSADPLQRWRMDESAFQGATIPLGDTVWGRMVGRVAHSRHPEWAVGDWVEGMLGWQTHAISQGQGTRAGYAPGVTRVDPALGPPSAALGVLGMPGLTAWCAMMDLCRPRPGETVVVSAAAGSVGSLACQIAALQGARVIGIAGGASKCRHLLDDLRVEAAIDYKSEPDLAAALRRLCPDGVDAYFDNVGGPVADAVFSVLARGARVALVGRVSQLTRSPNRIDRQEALIGSRAKLEGFIVYDHEHRFTEVRSQLAALLANGSLRHFETLHHGLEQAPQALIDVLSGRGIGKHLIDVRRSH